MDYKFKYSESVKFLEKIIEEYLQNLELPKEYLDMTPIAQIRKGEIAKGIHQK